MKIIQPTSQQLVSTWWFTTAHLLQHVVHCKPLKITSPIEICLKEEKYLQNVQYGHLITLS